MWFVLISSQMVRACSSTRETERKKCEKYHTINTKKLGYKNLMVKLFIMIPWNPHHRKQWPTFFYFLFFKPVRFAPLKGYHFPTYERERERERELSAIPHLFLHFKHATRAIITGGARKGHPCHSLDYQPKKISCTAFLTLVFL